MGREREGRGREGEGEGGGGRGMRMGGRGRGGKDRVQGLQTQYRTSQTQPEHRPGHHCVSNCF